MGVTSRSRRCRTPCCGRSSRQRLREHRRAAGHGDPARRASPTASSCRRSASSPSALGVSRNTLREAIAALRDSGLVTTRRGRGGGTSVTSTAELAAGTWRPGTFVRSGAAMLRRPDLPSGRRAGRGVAGRDPAAGRRPAGLARGRACARSRRRRRRRRRTGVADSRLHLAIATLSGSPMLVDAVTRVAGRPARHAHGHPGPAAQHRALQRPARAGRRRHPRRRRGPGAGGDGGALRRDLRAAAWPASDEDRSDMAKPPPH